MPWAIAEVEPEPSEPSTLMARILVLGATPTTPLPLLARAAMVPATWVPWPWSSMGSLSLLPKSGPLMTLPARSSWL
ncbi:hypothetical protein D3C86_1326160 [compost metagenome]